MNDGEVISLIKGGSHESAQELTPEQSRENLKAGIEKVKIILAGLHDGFIGAHTPKSDLERYNRGEVSLAEDAGLLYLDHLAFDKWTPLYYDELVTTTENLGYKRRYTDFIGSQPISSITHYFRGDKESLAYVADNLQVFEEDYRAFKVEVKHLLTESYEQRKTVQPNLRKLPPEIVSQIRELQLQDR